MLRLLMIGQESQSTGTLRLALIQNGFACSITSCIEDVIETVAIQSPHLVLFEINGHLPGSAIRELMQRLKQESSLPIIALVTRETLDGLDGHPDVDDFLNSPYDDKELVLRIKRLLRRDRITDSSEIIKCDGLMIDLATCEVTRDGMIIDLTFKEYELLKFLASNRGRVYTREKLLNSVWSYDYYGGDRTVDVHIRRLRSKIEDSSHTFIETVRNIGYRFRKEA